MPNFSSKDDLMDMLQVACDLNLLNLLKGLDKSVLETLFDVSDAYAIAQWYYLEQGQMDEKKAAKVIAKKAREKLKAPLA